ncbi:amidase [Primorskyibacter flagellatus]|uniref:Aspartyl-tRNA(Asn)/glutamyl-tRNA(Gln) amidotransferase subunit A n=1 Tax=Primorskyibacter flagellatus TaxID=1387277 RepID=A0A1W1ZWK2_9RHOB|nr:amidase family protein [Primorskyibacter flagellatus]SMC52612.1 aspartyl-tRNA(Asn)/glutamyl-tRNA(Gln) amidotransferase subunit A [Primorskyibacter flagellatus]
MQQWSEQSAAELGRGIGAGEIDPVALAEFFLDRIASHPLNDRIYARLTPDRAMAEAGAASARARAGRRLSPLDGVPCSWKDLFDTAGVATEAGSRLLEGRVPDRDAEVLRIATAMGLVCLGKTHQSELAFSGLGLNPMTQSPPCVNDESAVSGGSSSGTATSVAFGLAPMGIGSDTGGSVRVPAAWNDLVGLKTTSGRLSLSGTVPLCTRFDTVGPLTRTVEDAALALAVLEGRGPADLRGASLKGVRLADLRTIASDDLRDTPAAAYSAAVEKLQAAGAEVVQIDAPEVAEAMADTPTLYAGEAYGQWRDTIEAAPDKMFARILDRFRAGAEVSGPEFVAAWRRLDAHRATWAKRVAGFDAVICATAPNLPPNVDRLMNDPDYYVSENLMTLRNTRIGNLMGGAGLTLPTGVPSCGILFMGKAYGEEFLLRLGSAAEAVLR